MIRIGSHVYNTRIQANGIITDAHFQEDNYQVEFHWAKYCQTAHGIWTDKPEYGNKSEWCTSNELVELDMPWGPNTIRSTGRRSLDRLIRRFTGIKPYGAGKYRSDVVLKYGSGSFRQRNDAKLIINAHTEQNKYAQCRIMGEDLAPESHKIYDGSPYDMPDWIIKPFHSIGGKGIRPAMGDMARSGEYYQRRFNKVREFRVHCFLWEDDKVPFIQEKAMTNGDKNQLCWNKKQGGSFRYVYQKGLDYGKYAGDLSLTNRNIMTKMSIKALKLMHMDFGGLDFGMDANGKFKIFEINSRMGLRERSMFTYKQVLNSLRSIDINQYKAERWV